MIIKDEKDPAFNPIPAEVQSPPPYSPSDVNGVNVNRASSSRQQQDNQNGPQPQSPASTTSMAETMNYPQISPCNFLIKKITNYPSSDSYLLDPELDIPEIMLPPAPWGEARKNLKIDMENAWTTAKIWITEPPAEGSAKRATIDVSGANGFVTVQLHSPESRKFELNVTVSNGTVSLAIPRSFTGPLTTHTTNGWVTMSSDLASQVATFSELKGLRKSFVGDFASSGYGTGEWQGSTVNVRCANGRIKLSYSDDGDQSKNFFSKLFGR